MPILFVFWCSFMAFHSIGQCCVPVQQPMTTTATPTPSTVAAPTPTPTPTEVGIMTFNTWLYGTQVDNGTEKIVRSITEVVNRDGENKEWIIALQEVMVSLNPQDIMDLVNRFPNLTAEERAEFAAIFQRDVIEGLVNLTNILNERTPKTWSYIINDFETAVSLGFIGASRPVLLFTENLNLMQSHSAAGIRNVGGLWQWGDRLVSVWGIHLTGEPNTRLLLCQGATADEIRQAETDSRLKEIRALLNDSVFVNWTSTYDSVVLGDFNSPSNVDWDPTRNYNRHLPCGVKADFQFPVPIELATAGFVDVYRSSYPDVDLSPGYTWSPVFIGRDNTSQYLVPQDRVDMIWQKRNQMSLSLDSEKLPEVYDGLFWRQRPHTHIPSGGLLVGLSGPHRSNEWPSDHRAVIAHFERLN